MKLSCFTLYTKDMDKSMAFYTGILGLSIVRRLPTGDGKELVFLGTEGGPTLELVPAEQGISYAGFSIGFEVEQLTETKKHLEENGYPIKREFRPNPSTTLCFFDGPNGEEVELIYTQKMSDKN